MLPLRWSYLDCPIIWDKSENVSFFFFFCLKICPLEGKSLVESQLSWSGVPPRNADFHLLSDNQPGALTQVYESESNDQGQPARQFTTLLTLTMTSPTASPVGLTGWVQAKRASLWMLKMKDVAWERKVLSSCLRGTGWRWEARRQVSPSTSLKSFQ